MEAFVTISNLCSPQCLKKRREKIVFNTSKDLATSCHSNVQCLLYIDK